MNERRRLGLAGTACILLAACGALPFGPRSIEVPFDRLFEEMAGQFPFNRRLAQLLDVTISAPRFRPVPQQNRLATELDVDVGNSFAPKPLRGLLGLSYGLRYEPSDHSVRLANVRVERFRLDALPEGMQGSLGRMGTLLAEQMLDDLIVHRLTSQEHERIAASGLQPGAINVTPRGLVVTLERAAVR